jgi:hypothetical protein
MCYYFKKSWAYEYVPVQCCSIGLDLYNWKLSKKIRQKGILKLLDTETDRA